MLTRRLFLHRSGLTVGALAFVPAWVARTVAKAGTRRKVLVVIFERGAADGLNMVVPFFEKRYYELRPTIAIPPPGRPGGGIDLDGRFALHPMLAPLRDVWHAKQLAIVQAVGSPDPSRSHFDAQEFMESGTAGQKLEDGWLNRALQEVTTNASPLRAVAVTSQLPRTLAGSRGAVAIEDLTTLTVGTPETAAVLEQLYAVTGDPGLRGVGYGAFEAARVVDSLRRQPYSPANGAIYLGRFGQRLQQIARLIKADAGVEVAFTDIGGWDHHTNETAQLAAVLREFGQSVAAFARDLGDRLEDVVVVTMSEFGRTVAENGNGGTDHGHGDVMMVLGGAIRGGSVYGEWPGIAPEQLYEARDLAVTTDFRDVLGEIVHAHLGQDPGPVFPRYRAGRRLALLRN